MKTIHAICLLLIVFFLSNCTNDQSMKIIDIDLDRPQLTEAEKEAGRLTPELLWKMGRLGEVDLSPNQEQVAYIIRYYQLKKNKGNSSLYLMNIDGSEKTRLTDTMGTEYNPQFHPAGERLGFISTRTGSSQIWEINLATKTLKQITDVPDGINSFEYAPTGDKILYTANVKLDSSTLDKYPELPEANCRIIDELMYRHWDSWSDYSYSHIFVANLSEVMVTEGIDIMEGEKYDSPLPPYFDSDQICWAPDGKSIAYTAKKVPANEISNSTNSDIYIYNLESQETKNITSFNIGYDRYPAFSPDGKKLAWLSMETPVYEADKERLFVIDLETNETTYLTEGFDQNAGNISWNESGDKINFISGIKATYQIYEIDVTSKEITQLTKGKHNYRGYSMGNGFIIGTKMSMSKASELFYVDLSTGEEKNISEINSHIYEHLDFGTVEERWIKTTNGEDMLTWFIYPPDFDSTKKYPAILYCQGGPQSAVSQFFSFRWNFQLMAANEYIIVAPNRHGLPTFGQEWNRQISGDYGGQNMKDYLQAIDVAAEEPYIDKNNLGAIGASYGGYSVFYLAGIHEGRFSALVSHCGIFNLESFYATTEETFFPEFDLEGPFWKTPKPKSYTQFSPHLKVQNWDTPILIIGGEKDFRIPYTESLQAFNAARLQGVPARLIHYHDEGHWVLKPQNGLIWHTEFFGWLDRWLKE